MYFYLKEPKSEKETLIYLIYSKFKFKYSTSKKIKPKDWDFNSLMPKTLKGRSDLNVIRKRLNEFTDHLNSILSLAEFNEIEITKEYLTQEFNSHFNKERAGKKKSEFIANGVLDFIEIKNKSKGVSKSWNEKYYNLFIKLKLFDFYKKKEQGFEGINSDWIDEYSGFLRDLPNIIENNQYLKNRIEKFSQTHKFKLPSEGYLDNTLNRHINFLKTYLIWAVPNYKFSENKIVNPVKKYDPEDVYLTFEDLEKLENLKPSRESLERVRDVFLVGVYSGQRYSDYSVLNKSDIVKTSKGEIIIKKAEKTEYDSFIPISKKLRSILDKYDWKLPKISDQRFNDHIKEVGFEAKLFDTFKKFYYRGDEKRVKEGQKYEFLSTHTARRTFITLSLENGMHDKTVMKIAGIRNIETLYKYKKTTKQSIEDAYLKIWG